MGLKKTDTTTVEDWFQRVPDKYQSFEPYQEDTFEDLNCVCSISDKSPSVCKGLIKARIGSRSMAGEVYILDYKETQTALKIMPIITPDSEKENNNEIEKALSASRIKTSGKSVHFLAVYGYGLCPDVSLKGSFDEKMKQYSAYYNIIRSLPSDKRRRAGVLYKTLSYDDWMKIYGNSSSLSDTKKKAHILISELGVGDLFTILSSTRDAESWINYITQSLYAIHDMQIHMKAVHGDLHGKNLLVMRNGDVCVHDFGKSSYPVIWTIKTHTDDIEFFLSDIMSEALREVIPSEVRKILESIQDEITTLIEDTGEGEILAPNEKNSVALYMLKKFL